MKRFWTFLTALVLACSVTTTARADKFLIIDDDGQTRVSEVTPGLGVSPTSQGDITWGDNVVECIEWSFDVSGTDTPRLQWCLDTGVNGGGRAWTELDPGAHDLRVSDDILLFDNSPNIRWYDLHSGTQDFEMQADTSDIVLKIVGDITAGVNLNYSPGIYDSRRFMIFHGSTDGGATDDILQFGEGINGISFGDTASPNTFFQFTRLEPDTSDIVDLITVNLRSSGTVAAGFGLAEIYLLEDAAGSSGQTAAKWEYVWQDPTNLSEDVEVILSTTSAGVVAQAMRFDESRRLSVGPTTGPTTRLYVTDEVTATTSSTEVLTLDTRSTGTAGTGFGTGLQFAAENAAGTTGTTMAKIESRWNSATASAETAELIFHEKINGAMAEVGRFDEQGWFGIGATNPLSKLNVALDVVGTSDTQDVITIDRRTTGTAAAGLGAGLKFTLEDAGGSAGINAASIETEWQTPTAGAATSELVFKTRVANTFGERMRIDEQGFLGLGTTGPTAPIHSVLNDTATTSVTTMHLMDHRTSSTAAAGFGSGMLFTLEDGAGSQGINAGGLEFFWNDATNGAATSELSVKTRVAGAYNERLRVDENGRLGVGQPNPGSMLHATLSDAATTTTTNVIQLDHRTSGIAAAGFGAGFIMQLEDDAGAAGTSAASLEATWQSAVAGAATSELIFKSRVLGVFGERARFDENGRFSVGNTNPTGMISVDQSTQTGVTTEHTMFYSDGTSYTLPDATTIANFRHNRLTAPTINGIAGGNTETVTTASTLNISGAPSGSDITFTNGPYALHVDGGISRFDGHIVTNGTAPTISSCGTSPSVTGNDNNGRVTIGTGTITSCTATFASAWKSAPMCVVSGSNTGVTLAVSTSTTALTITSSAAMDSHVVHYHCLGTE